MLILKQNAANSVPTPPAGKGTIFLDDVDTLSVKTSDGNVETFPTVNASNSQVVFMNGTSLSGEAALTYDFNNNVLTIGGNVAAGNVKTDNLLYANGVPWDLSDPGGSNTQIQFNDNESFGGSAALTFDKSSNAVTMSGNLSAGNVSATTFTGALSGAATSATTAGTVTTAAQPNITSVGTLTGLTVSSNITGSVTGSAATVTTAAQPNITSVGTLTSLIVSGNASAGNVNTAGKVVASTLESNVSTGTAPFVVASQTKVTNLNADLLDGMSTNTLNTGLTIVNRDADGSFAANIITATLSGAATTAGTVTTAAQPNITSVGSLTSLTVTGNASAGNISTGGVLSVTGNANVGNLGTAGLVVATGNVTGGNLTTAGVVAATGNVSGGNLTTAGALSVTGNANVGNLGTAGLVVATGNVTGGNLVTGGVLSVTGNANVGNIGGNNAVFTLVTGTLTTAAQPNVTSVGTLTSLSVTGNISAGNVSATTFTGALSGAATTAGTVTTAAQPNITSVGTLSSLAVTANVAAGNLTTTGILSVTGTGVSSIAGNLDMTSNTIINLATPTNSTDAATKQYVDDVAQGLHTHDSCNAATQTTLATISGGTVTYNNGTDGVGATLTTTGSYTTIDGVTLSNGMRILVKNEANAAHNGIYDRTSTTVLTRSTDFDQPVEMAGGDFVFITAGTLYDNTGWVMTDPVTTVGTTNVNWTQFSGAGAFTAGTGLTLTGTQFSITNTAVSAGSYGNGDAVATFTVNAQGQLTAASNVAITANAANLTGTLAQARLANSTLTLGNTTLTLGATTTTVAGLTSVTSTSFVGALTGAATTAGTVTTAAQPNITSTGTLTSLAVTGNISAGNVSATTFTGALSGAATSATTAGTVTTAAQPNITSVGTLTSLAVTGNISAGNVSATTFTGALSGAATTAGTVTTAAQGNITSVGTLTGLGVNGTITAVNITANTGVFAGNGSSLTALNGSNISSGTIAQARLANSSLTVNGTSISLGGSGTITANTTQTLTLGSFLTGTSFNGGTAVTAAVDATSTNTASKVVARDASGNFAAGTITATLSGAATTAGTVTTAAQPNITSVGTLTSLSVSGGITNANLTTGANTTAGSLTGNWTLTSGSRLQATYADLAEKYTADGEYAPGTVLVFGGDNEVTISHEFDSHRVAGVVSTNPAYIMNSGCQGEHVVDLALQGRVPVKVTGQVHKGDLMVSGPNGHAVSNNMARAGTIIGKALQNFSGDHGVIEIVVGRV